MKIGTYYYPEQWPRAQWERDFDKIASMGLKIVHMAEFAWYALEPTRGDYQMDWLDDCVRMCRERDLDVILCTPTAAPPIWLSEEYPEVLPLNEHGTRGRHGGRRHYTPTSPRFQEAAYNITKAMADRFGRDKSVIGWQIDNELSGAFDQSEHTHAAFRKWLEHKYTTIENLNAAWGNQFWNQYYQSFDQILMPVSRDPRYGNPHHCLDASRFWSSVWAEFVQLQATVLDASFGNVVRKPFVTTNFMPFMPDCDPHDMRESLTLYSWDTYPVSGFGANHKDDNYRSGDPATMQFTHDLMASYNGRWALMEVQPGQINWSGYPVLPPPGTIRLFLWTAIAHGCEFITVYRFRQPRFGVEMWHDGLIELDGVTPSKGGEQFAQVAREAKQLWGDTHPTSTASDQPVAGLVYEFDQRWLFDSLGQAKRWNYPELICQYHQALSRLGYRVRIINPGEAYPVECKIIVAPAVQMMEVDMRSRMESYVKQGGHLLLTCRSGLQDRTGTFHELRYGDFIRDLIGARITQYDSLPEATFGKVDLDGTSYEWGVWGDQLEPQKGTEAWAKYTTQFYAGAAAITHRKAGSGSVTYNGVYGDREFAAAVVAKLSRTIGQNATLLGPRLRVVHRDGYAICLNYADQPAQAPAPAGAKFVIGERTVPPSGVSVWKV